MKIKISEKEKNHIAKYISVMLTPIITLSITFTTVTFKYGETKNEVFMYLLLTVISLYIPLLILFVTMKKLGYIKGFHVESRKARYPVYIVVITSLFFTIYGLITLGSPVQIILFALSYMLIFLINFIINFFTKVSMHTSSYTFFLSIFLMMFSDVPEFYIVILCFIGLIGLIILIWSRVYMKKHTLSQVILGSFIGFLVIPYIFIMNEIYTPSDSTIPRVESVNEYYK